MYRAVKGFAREHLPKPVWGGLIARKQAVSDCVNRGMGLLAEGPEARIWVLDGTSVIKAYSPAYFEQNEKFERPHEGELLAGVESPHIVRLLEHTHGFLTLERLGKPVGTYKGIVRVQNPDALVRFLDNIGPELKNAGLRNHDLHWGNILPTLDGKEYKDIDLAWGRRDGEQGYSLPEYLNQHYSPNDATAIDLLRRDLDKHLAKHPQ